MHLLIILLQQLLGMLPSSKQVPQPEVVRNGSASPNSAEPDACVRIALTLCGWMTPFNPLPPLPKSGQAFTLARRPQAVAGRLRHAAEPPHYAGTVALRAGRA